MYLANARTGAVYDEIEGLAPGAESTLTGVLERIIFLNEENHYTIAELRPEAPAGADRRPDLVTIVGALPGVELLAIKTPDQLDAARALFAGHNGLGTKEA